MSTSAPPVQNRPLAMLQWVLACAIAIVSVISSPRQVLWEASKQANIPVEFRVIALSIPDYFLIALLLVSILRLIIDETFRAHLSTTLSIILSRHGGIWWVGLAIWMGLGIFWAREPIFVRFDTIQVIAALAGVLFIADLARSGRGRSLIMALLAGAAAQAVVAVLQILNQGPIGLGWLGEVDRFWYDTAPFYRAPGLSMHPNYLAGYLLIALFGALLIARQNIEQSRSIVLPAIGGLLGGVGLVATMSRSGLLAAVVGLIPALSVAVLSLKKRLRLTVIAVLGVLVLVVGIWAAIVILPNVQTRLLASREFFFHDTFEVIGKTPLLGVGAGNLMLEIGRNQGESSTPLLPVHNVFLYIWAELGIPGLALFVAACLAILIQVRPRNGLSVFTWGSCFLAMCVVMLFDNYFWAVQPFRDLTFWVIGLWWGYACHLEVPHKAG
jgi:hypothetical protein